MNSTAIARLILAPSTSLPSFQGSEQQRGGDRLAYNFGPTTLDGDPLPGSKAALLKSAGT